MGSGGFQKSWSWIGKNLCESWGGKGIGFPEERGVGFFGLMKSGSDQ